MGERRQEQVADADRGATTIPVGVVGASGYGGAELVRLLADHPALSVAVVTGGEQAGRRLDDSLPSLTGLEAGAMVLAPSTPEALAGCELVLLATPHGPSLELAPTLVDRGQLVVDLSGAFRLDAAAFARHYGQPHPCPERTPAPYGLPELFRDDLADAALIAGPGCYPTATLLALAPLLGLIDPDTVVVSGLSGTSGAGRKQREDLHASHAFGNAAPYGLPSHRHRPEIAARCADLSGRTPRVSFAPHLAPTSRGQLCTVVADLADGVDPAAPRDALVARYADEPLVHVLEPGAWPHTAHVVGSAGAHLAAAVDEEAGRVVAACALDNLLKGAASQAIQAANVRLGLPEASGLPVAGVYP